MTKIFAKTNKENISLKIFEGRCLGIRNSNKSYIFLISFRLFIKDYLCNVRSIMFFVKSYIFLIIFIIFFIDYKFTYSSILNISLNVKTNNKAINNYHLPLYFKVVNLFNNLDNHRLFQLKNTIFSRYSYNITWNLNASLQKSLTLYSQYKVYLMKHCLSDIKKAFGAILSNKNQNKVLIGKDRKLMVQHSRTSEIKKIWWQDFSTILLTSGMKVL